jgi:cobalt-zinc-cadmium efflux system membrane fusion protein
MKPRLLLSLLAILVVGGGVAYTLTERHPEHEHAHAESKHDHDEPSTSEHARGSHGGRLLTDGDFATELSLFDTGMPPEFRVWFTRSGAPIPPNEVQLSVELTRPGGMIDKITFARESDYLRSTTEVHEPHSFDYAVVAQHDGRTHRWQFSAPEMQTTISAEAAKRAGVVVEPAGPATLVETIAVYGQVKLNANKIARAAPRFGGIVRESRKAVGESVTAGEVVAIVETNQSLVTIEVKSPISGVILDREVNAGETVADGSALYTIADFSEVWIDFNVPLRDQSRVKVGQAATIEANDRSPDSTGTVSWISPSISAEAQTVIARVVLQNPDQSWRPGLFVKGGLKTAESQVPVAVKESALQTLSEFTVVFSQHGEIYQARPLQLGRRGGGYVEVLEGIKAGERYVTENSFLIKADIGKSGAAHEH